MDQFAKCFYNGCVKKPENLCRCKGKCIFICDEHSSVHKMQAGEHSYEMIYINVETAAILGTLKQNIQAINELRSGCLKEFSCFVRKIAELHSKMMTDLDNSENFLMNSMKILIESPIKQVEHNWNVIKGYNKYVWRYMPEAFSLKSVFMAAEKHYNQEFIGYFVVEKALMVSKERVRVS